MFYIFPHNIATGYVEAAPHRIDMDLTTGIIHQVDIVFQDGCNHEAHVVIFHGRYQVWPTNRGESFEGNATVVSFREFYELDRAPADLYAMIWGDGSIENVKIVIQVGLLPKKIILPLSFEELLAAAAGLG